MIIKKAKNKYSGLCNNNRIIDLEALEVFACIPNIQKCDTVLMGVGQPFTNIKFKKEEALTALLYVSIETFSRRNISSHVKIYLNGFEIENCILEELVTNESCDKFLTNYKILQDNVIIIHRTNLANWLHFKQILVYSVYCEDGYTPLQVELARWKALLK